MHASNTPNNIPRIVHAEFGCVGVALTLTPASLPPAALPSASLPLPLASSPPLKAAPHLLQNLESGFSLFPHLPQKGMEITLPSSSQTFCESGMH
jgi:hypothetical protein